MVSSQVISSINVEPADEVTIPTRSVEPFYEEETGPDFNDFPEMNDNDFDAVQMQLLNAGPKVRRTSQARKKALDSSFELQSINLRASIRDSENVIGLCSINGCEESALYRSPSSITGLKVCFAHGESVSETFPDLIDAYGKPFKFEEKSSDYLWVTIIDPHSWRFEKKGQNYQEKLLR